MRNVEYVITLSNDRGISVHLRTVLCTYNSSQKQTISLLLLYSEIWRTNVFRRITFLHSYSVVSSSFKRGECSVLLAYTTVTLIGLYNQVVGGGWQLLFEKACLRRLYKQLSGICGTVGIKLSGYQALSLL